MMCKLILPKLKRPHHLLWIIAVLFISVPMLAQQEKGSITSMTVTGGAQIGDTITINVTLQAQNNVNNSNLYLEIRAPDGTVVAFTNISPPSMGPNDTYTATWTLTNASFPLMGNYTLSACWSPGGSPNCSVASSTTTFYSADTLSSLKWIGLLLFAIWLVRNRKYFTQKRAA